MLIIEPTTFRLKKNYCLVETPFSINGKSNVLWYSFPEAFKDYVVSQQVDAAVVALLSLAFQENVNIKVNAPLSAKLFYTLNHYVLPAMAIAHKKEKNTFIEANQLNKESLNICDKKGTGVSCGVDSLTTIATHKSLDYLFYLNAGSHGNYGGERAASIFNLRKKNAENFSNKIKLPIVDINSNLSELLKSDFQSFHSLRQLSCLLNLQKLISTYYYSSAYRLDYFKLDKNDTSSWDVFLVKMLETESISFYSASSQYTRFEKTKIIGDYELAQLHLDVCTNPNLKANNLNCSSCDKCLRTLLSLELHDNLDNFKDVFNLAVYKKYRKNFILSLKKESKKNPIAAELYQASKILRNEIHFISKTKYSFNTIHRGLKKQVKKQIKF